MMLPIIAMVSCAVLGNTQICEDASGKMYLCVHDNCATIQSLRIEWKHHPEKQLKVLREVYGQ